MAVMGIIILVVAVVGILYLRHYTNTHGGPVLKTAMKIGDFFIWLRFIGFAILILLFIILAAKHSK